MNLADVYSYLESLRRGTNGLLANPTDTLNQWGSQIKEDLGKYDQGNAKAMGLLGSGDYSGAGKAAVQNNMGLGSGLLGALHIAYHGTPHTVDKFSMDKVGTGEGAQAYGHGLYFAGNPETADYYRKALSIDATINGQPLMKSGDMVGTTGDKSVDNLLHPYLLWNMPVEAAAGAAEASGNAALAQKARALAPNIKTSVGGNLYKVDINADPAHYLDWDKPLSEQSAQVRDLLGNTKAAQAIGPDRPAGDVFSALGFYDGIQPKQVPQLFTQAGIPGIKYKDAGSRGLDSSGTHNYVVFDDSLINNLGPHP